MKFMRYGCQMGSTSTLMIRKLIPSLLAFLCVAAALQSQSCCAQESENVDSTTLGDANAPKEEPGGDNNIVECSPIYATGLNRDGCKKALNKIYNQRVPKYIAVSKDRVPLWFADDDAGM